MGCVTRRILERCVDVGFFKVGEVLQELSRRHAAGKHFKHVAHRDSHTANRRFTTAQSVLMVIRSICMRLFIRTSGEHNLILNPASRGKLFTPLKNCQRSAIGV